MLKSVAFNNRLSLAVKITQSLNNFVSAEGHLSPLRFDVGVSFSLTIVKSFFFTANIVETDISLHLNTVYGNMTNFLNIA